MDAPEKYEDQGLRHGRDASGPAAGASNSWAAASGSWERGGRCGLPAPPAAAVALGITDDGRDAQATAPVVSDDGAVSEQAVFRIPPLATLGAVLLAVCVTPFAFGAPYFWLVYLLPVGAVVWVLRVRTIADAEALAVRRLVGSRRVPWSQIRSLHLRDNGGVRAVLTDGSELPLPCVHVRDLPQLAAASGGHLSMGDE